MSTTPPTSTGPPTNPRWKLERAVLASELPPPARQVLLTLAVLADWPSGRTPAEHTPSLTRLARSTGLSRSTVADHLNRLESDGWVTRLRPGAARAQAEKARTQYRLVVPGTGPGGGLVQHPDQSATRTSPIGGPALVRHPDGASPPAGHVPDLPQTNQTKKERTPAPPKVDASAVVAAFVEGATTNGQDRPTNAIIGKVGRDARRLIGEGIPLDKLAAAASAMGCAGWSSLDIQLQRMSAQRVGAGRARTNGHQAYRDRDEAAYHEGAL